MAVLLALLPVIGKAAAAPYLLVLVPLVIWTAVTNTERALYVYCAWCWMDGSIRGLFDGHPVAIVARDLVLLIITACWLGRRLRDGDRDPLRLPPVTPLVALFAVNCLLEIGNPYSLGLVSSLAGLKMHLLTIPLLFLGYDVFRRGGQVRSLFLFLTLATLVISVVSLVQYNHGREWTYAHFPGTKEVISQSTNLFVSKDTTVDVGFKPPGTTTFGGGTGGFIGSILPLTFVLLLLGGKLRLRPTAKVALAGVFCALVVALLLNSVRSGLVGAAACVLLCGLLAGGRLRVRVLAGGLACLVLALVAWVYAVQVSQGGVAARFGATLANPLDTLRRDRYTFFDQAEELAANAPLGLGMGRVGAAGAAADQLAANKDTLQYSHMTEAYLSNMISETGIQGALLISAIAVLFLLRGLQAVRRTRDADDRLLASCLLATLAVMVAGFFVAPVLLGLPGAVVFWLFGGILLRVFGTAERESGHNRGAQA